MFPNFFSGESGSLTSLFFLVLFVVTHLCAAEEKRQFLRGFGSNIYIVCQRERLENSLTAAIIYGFGSLWMAGSMSGAATLFGLAVWCYGARVAWLCADAITLKLVRNRIGVAVAERQLAQGHFNPPVEAPPRGPAPLMIEHDPVVRHGNMPITPAPQDERGFAFDPDRFKR